jgi:hypothetical protein
LPSRAVAIGSFATSAGTEDVQSSQNPYSIAKPSVCTVEAEANATEGMLVSREPQETELQQMLLLVELAQRAGCTETEISELVDGAVEADAKLERAA